VQVVLPFLGPFAGNFFYLYSRRSFLVLLNAKTMKELSA
jgi:hypothetical protein